MTDEPEFDGPAWLRPTAVEALQEYEAFKRRGWEWPCRHPRLTEEGYCRRCGKDCRGIG